MDTRSHVSTAAVVSFLTPLCRAAGLDVATLAEMRDGVRQLDLVATRGEPTSDAVLLCTHLDTVPPGDAALWTRTGGDPFALTEHDGRLYGLGTADVKLDFLCKLMALARLSHTSLRRGVLLAGTYGEETGRFGAQLLVRRLSPLPLSALVGEPTELRPVVSHKGYLEVHVEAGGPVSEPSPQRGAAQTGPAHSLWRVDFTGVAAHSSQPHLGRSAISACLAALITWLAPSESTARTEGRSEQGTAADPRVVLAVAGGEIPNKVADRCSAIVASRRRPELAGASAVERLDPTDTDRSVLAQGAAAPDPRAVRLLLAVYAEVAAMRDRLLAATAPGFDPPYTSVNVGVVRLTTGHLRFIADIRRIPGEAAASILEQGLGRIAAVVDEADEGLCATFRRVLETPPFANRPDSPLLRAVQDELLTRGRTPEPAGKSGTTEAAVYQAAGMDTVIFGPGPAAGNIHRPNEHVPLEHLYAAVDVYEGVIRRLCL